jgi:metal-responsive CopG/Arc/MetJ family transcriptional regulator
MPRPKLHRERFNATLPADLLLRVDRSAEASGMTRSSFIQAACEAELRRRQQVERTMRTMTARVSLAEQGKGKDTPTRHERGDTPNSGPVDPTEAQ